MNLTMRDVDSDGLKVLPRCSLSPALGDPQVEVMNFLNEVALRFPSAISFAPGRPPEAHFDVKASLDYIERYLQSQAGDAEALASGYAALGQYGRTNGTLGELIARLLWNDEGIALTCEDVAVTVGCQEAMCLLLLGLCGHPGDVALVPDPAYIGMSGAARVLGVETCPVPARGGGLDLDALEHAVVRLSAQGKRPRLIYMSPDFANPTGECMTLEQRRRLLSLSRRLNLLIVEDHAYNYFQYDGDRLPAFRSLPGSDHVIFVGSFSKSVYPGVRLGFIASTLRIDAGEGRTTRLVDELSKIKSLLTVNTSPLCQAIIGGLLITHDCSLMAYVAPRRDALMRNRDAMLASLQRHFPRDAAWCNGIHWNRPAGGFFLSLEVPFLVSDQDLMVSARDHGVLWTPMSYFHHTMEAGNQIRLSFSYASVPSIDAGIGALAQMVRSRVQHGV
ncbi:PLP-dependent aminotransferase family protein [Xanthomonas melonis]|uniref:PLP-dependent aminotransferase family protein n=1 Tax=Xanthomonas melonis TaxID=56456 RepID=A0ABS8NPR6_9XANT|nr:PLP-dependent aminotransferase family protein [Xanthomonas melonis]MCD0244457.1 PLP-dependent aminotransferase family protein [Xanthomonas melonis]MCD0256804.1 PLP-dependent aminotransferase family protein [Xanthomonas melonis]MCD0265066.1 PLP-dependent aminotransferase family protein [Xanthomonas melonis]